RTGAFTVCRLPNKSWIFGSTDSVLWLQELEEGSEKPLQRPWQLEVLKQLPCVVYRKIWT
ncbi:hypothetical protein LSAT2_027327, partial [Lamellibrachia satsuma]